MGEFALVLLQTPINKSKDGAYVSMISYLLLISNLRIGCARASSGGK